MNPIVPTIMALGVIIFLIGITVQVRLGVDRINVVKMLGKEIKLFYFVVVTVGIGTVLIMSSVLLHKFVPYQPDSGNQSTQPILSGNLKYELESTLSSLNLDKGTMMTAINRFQAEYQDASQRGDKNTMDLLLLEMAYRVRAELQNRNLSEGQIDSDVERVMGLLKQQPKK